MRRVSQLYKDFNRQPRLPNNGPQCSARDITSRVIRYDGSPVCHRMIPDFMTSFGVSVEHKTGFPQLADNLGGCQRWKAGHVSIGTGMATSTLAWGRLRTVKALGSASLCSMQDSINFRATSSAISRVSAMVRPWAMSPWRTGLVAKYRPSLRYSTVRGMRYSDMALGLSNGRSNLTILVVRSSRNTVNRGDASVARSMRQGPLTPCKRMRHTFSKASLNVINI